jgi:hypothetical protein
VKSAEWLGILAMVAIFIAMFAVPVITFAIDERRKRRVAAETLELKPAE